MQTVEIRLVTSPSGGQPEETAEHRRVTSSSDADEVYDERVAVETSFSVNPDNTSCVSSTRKLSETKPPPPKKKSAAAKAMKPNKWKTNYKIVEILCGVLDSMATSVVGNHERLGWTELVGNDKHPCPYLYSKRKVSLFTAVSFIMNNDRADKTNKMVKRIGNFLKSTKYVDKEKMPAWKRDLINELKLDIQK